MRILTITLLALPLLTFASVAKADYYIGAGRCEDGDKLVHFRECVKAGVSGRHDGFAVGVCCKVGEKESKYEADDEGQYDEEMMRDQ